MTNDRQRALLLADLAPAKLPRPIERIVRHLAAGDFRAGDVKKLAESDYYRETLDDANRLILRFARDREETVIPVVEVILNHAYERSRFLRGVTMPDVNEGRPVNTAPRLEDLPRASTLRYVHPTSRQFHLLDKPISFDDAQAR